MNRLFSIFLLILLSLPLYAKYTKEECKQLWNNFFKYNGPKLERYYASLVNKCDDDFRNAMKEIVKANLPLEYGNARKHIFDISQQGGQVCCIYTNRCLNYNGQSPDSALMNIEHSWPQSKGAKGIAKSDLHHLYAVDSKTNSRRGNFPFCETEQTSWQQDGSKMGSTRNTPKCFEPKDTSKGTIARSMLYFAIRYDFKIDQEQEYFFKKWNKLHDVDMDEKDRHNKAYQIQKNRNPFVDHPDFAQFIADI